MKSICVLLAIMAVVQVTQLKAIAQTPTTRSKVVEQLLLGCPDRVAVVQYDPARDEVDITIVSLTEVQKEYERLKAKPDRNPTEYRRLIALAMALGTYRT